MLQLLVCLGLAARLFLLAKGSTSSLVSSGYYFTPMDGFLENGESAASLSFNRIYHQCGIKQDCNFVVFNIKDKSYKMVPNVADLPANKEDYKVWKKLSTEMRTCSDWYKNDATDNGIYTVLGSNGASYPVYCDFRSEANSTWTLVMSFALKNKVIFNVPMYDNLPQNENNPNWEKYRLSKTRTEELKSVSKLWRATCNFPSNGVDYRDYLRVKTSSVDLTGKYNGDCKTVEFIDIRGQHGYGIRVPFYQQSSQTLSMHIDISHVDCDGFRANVDSSEDYFGHYHTTNKEFRCVQGQESSTQYWFGDYK